MKRLPHSLVILAVIALAGCEESATEVQQHQQEAIMAQGNSSVGMPAITHFQEKRVLKDIFEMRDKAVTTITYTQDLNAGLHKLCDSIGFGIPYATQYTNPQFVNCYAGGHCATLPQADPNGLFSPASAEGTWVLCKDPGGNKVAPVYVEPRIVVSTFPLGGVR